MVVGGAATGKTCLIHRIAHDEFSPRYMPTIGPELASKDVSLASQTIQFRIWDTCGQEKMIEEVKRFARNAEVGIVVFDTTNADSLGKLSVIACRWAVPCIHESATVAIGMASPGHR